MNPKRPWTTVGVVLKPGLNPHESPITFDLIRLLTLAGADVIVEENADTSGLNIPGARVGFIQELVDSCEFIISIGGDGTMLGLMREAAVRQTSDEGDTVKLVGVNMGTLGFITDIELKDGAVRAAEQLISMIRDRKFMYEHRATLQIQAQHEKHRELAANDILLQRAAGRLLDFRVEFNGRFAYDCRGDGLLISTPTGSTAYALAAGGPIIEATADVIQIMPMMPQNLSSRPIIVHIDTVIKVTITGPERAKLYIDGNEIECEACSDYTITSGPSVYFAYPVTYEGEDRDFTKALRNKLGWNRNL